MKTNELKKGDRVRLRNGWEAEIADNRKGNVRLAKVFVYFTKTGSIYAHAIEGKLTLEGSPADWIETPIEHTDAQKKLRK